MTRAPLEHAERIARQIGNAIKAKMPEGWGFILWLESFGEKGFATYLSSIERETAIRSLKEWIARMETTPATSDFVDATQITCWCCGGVKALVTLRGPHRSVEVCAECILRSEK